MLPWHAMTARHHTLSPTHNIGGAVWKGQLVILCAELGPQCGPQRNERGGRMVARGQEVPGAQWTHGSSLGTRHTAVAPVARTWAQVCGQEFCGGAEVLQVLRVLQWSQRYWVLSSGGTGRVS